MRFIVQRQVVQDVRHTFWVEVFSADGADAEKAAHEYARTRAVKRNARHRVLQVVSECGYGPDGMETRV